MTDDRMRHLLRMFLVVGFSLLGPQFAAADILYRQTFDATTSQTDPWGMITDYPELFAGVSSSGGAVAVDSTGDYAHQMALTAEWGVVRADSSVILGESSWPVPLSISADIGVKSHPFPQIDAAAVRLEIGANLFLEMNQSTWGIYSYYDGVCHGYAGTAVNWSSDELAHASLALTQNGSTFNLAYSFASYSGTVMGLPSDAIGALTYVGILGYGPAGSVAYLDNLTVSTPTTPEPSAAILLSGGTIGLLAYAWRKRKRIAGLNGG